MMSMLAILYIDIFNTDIVIDTCSIYNRVFVFNKNNIFEVNIIFQDPLPSRKMFNIRHWYTV